MSELILKKGICRIVVETTDKDDYWLNAESDVKPYEVIRIEKSNAEEDKHKEYESRRCIKRSGVIGRNGPKKEIGYNTLQREDIQESNNIEYYNRHLERTHDMKRPQNELNCDVIEKRLCLQRQNMDETKDFVSSVKRFKSNESLNLLKNENSIVKATPFQQRDAVRESGKTGHSQSYLQMTDAVKRLTEGLSFHRNQDILKGSSIISQPKVEESNRSDAYDASSYIMCEGRTVNNKISSSLENKESGIATNLQTTATISRMSKMITNPLRTFRLNRNDGRCAPQLSPQISPFLTSTSLQISDVGRCLGKNAEDKLFDKYLQMSDDAINVKMAAEALSLLKNKGRYPRMEEYVKTGPHVSVQISDAASCTASNAKNPKLEVFNTPLQLSSKGINEPNWNTLEPWQVKYHMLFDSALEITDAATGAKIPLESLYLKSLNTKNGTNRESDRHTSFPRQDEHQLSDKFQQLPENITCIKVPLGLLQDEDEKSPKEMKEHNEPRYENTRTIPEIEVYPSMQTSSTDGCFTNGKPLNLLKKKDITKDLIESSRYTALDQKNVEKLETKLSNVLPKMSIPSTFVQIPLEAVHLPTNAATGVKIPFQYKRTPRNEDVVLNKTISGHIETHFGTQSYKESNVVKIMKNEVETFNLFGIEYENEQYNYLQIKRIQKPEQIDNLEKLPNVEKTGKVPTSIFTRKDSRDGTKTHFVARIKDVGENIKLPLEPRLRRIKKDHTPGEKEINRHHSDISMFPLDAKSNVQLQRAAVKEKPIFLSPKNDTTVNRDAQQSEEEMEELKCYVTSPEMPSNKINEDIKKSKHFEPGLTPTCPNVSNYMKSPTLDTVSSPKSVEIKKEMSPTHHQQVAEIRKAGPSHISDVTKYVSASLDVDISNLIKKEEYFHAPVKKPATVKAIKTPLEAFSLLINDDMIQRILKYTNVRIARLASKAKSRNCFKNSSTENELKAFLGLLLISGALKQNTITVPEIWSECFGAGIYRATLHESRFHVLAQSICFGDSGSHITSKYTIKDEASTGNLWEEYLNNCKKYSVPLLHFKANEKIGKTSNATDGDDEPGYLYSTARKTVNMPLRILFSMLDGAGIRGVAMFRRVNPMVKMCHREFLKNVGMSLIRPHLRSKLLKTTLKRSTRELIEAILFKKIENDQQARSPTPPADNSLKKQKRCQLCAWNKDRKTKYQCESCQRAMCKEHRTDLCVDCVQDLM